MNPVQHQGLLIVFEGTDGTGKSTQIDLLNKYLQQNGYPVVTTYEPTNGRYGQIIRNLYSDRAKYSPEKELQLFLEDRREHVNTLIKPALNQGKIILCDRYFLSTAAYQGAIGFDPEEILQRNAFAPDPDIAFLLQLPLEEALSRIVDSRGDTLNDFEGFESLKKVDKIFNSIDRSYICKIDASGSATEVHHRIITHLTPVLATFSPDQP